MNTFWRLLEESIIVQSLVTLGLTAAVCYLTIVGKEVPDALLNLTLITMGFWFGQKVNFQPRP